MDDVAALQAAADEARDQLKGLGYDPPLGDSDRRQGPIAELRALIADKLIYWAFRLDRERFRIR